MAIYYTYQHAGAWEAANTCGYLFGNPAYGIFQDEDYAYIALLTTGSRDNMSNGRKSRFVETIRFG
ncbi:hypothetical protein [Exiguobacterium sp. s56]|uniref:hypothetical protein n=1 Tax=Exiguobacterium sp. s56 TaxID=2751232 RepID=UPI0033387FE6